MEYICDNKRHLVCKPYSLENLHLMAKDLRINICWFHKNHYDIPKGRIQDIVERCTVVSPKEIVRIIKGTHEVKEYNKSTEGTVTSKEIF